MKTGQEEVRKASLSDIKKEMAVPRMAQSARRAISQQNRRPSQRRRASMEALPKISFDLTGVVTLKASFRPGKIFFSQGDFAETLMYIQSGKNFGKGLHAGPP